MVNKVESRIRGGWSGQISEVRPWLFLSGARAIRPNRLRPLGLTHVINATAELPHMTLEGIDTIRVRILDVATTTLVPHLHAVADRMESIKQSGGKLLVHCVAGVSRSSALVLAYLMKHERLSLKEAFLQVRQVRPVVRPNSNFFRQLIEFERQELGGNSVTLVSIPNSNLVIPDVCEDELELIKSRTWAKMVNDRRYFQNHFA